MRSKKLQISLVIVFCFAILQLGFFQEQQCWWSPEAQGWSWEARHDMGSLLEYLPIPVFVNVNLDIDSTIRVLSEFHFEVVALRDNLRAWTDIPNSRIAFAYQGYSLGPFTNQMGEVRFKNSQFPFGGRSTLRGESHYLTGFIVSLPSAANYNEAYYETGHMLGHSIGVGWEPGDYAWPHDETHAHGDSSNKAMVGLHPDGNERPIAVIKSVTPFTYPPRNGYTIIASGQTITVDASTSYDPDGTIHKYLFNFDYKGNIHGQPTYDHTRDGPNSVITTSPQASWTYTLAQGETSRSFTIRVMVCDSNGGIDYLNPYAGTHRVSVLRDPDTTPPSTPSLTVTAGDGTVTLRWSSAWDNSQPISYVIYRKSIFSGTYEERATTLETSFVDNLVINGVTYNYYVVAKDFWGIPSQPSQEVSSTPVSSNPRPPILDPIPNQIVVEEKTITFTVHALDPNADEVFLQMQNLNNLQGTILWDWSWIQGGKGANGTISITPQNGLAGDYNFRFTASDTGGLTSSVTVKLTVSSSFVIDAIYGDTNGWYGQTRNHRAVVKNQGGNTSQPASLKIYLSTDENLSPSDILLETVSVLPLNAGQATIVNYSIPIPTNWPSYHVVAIARIENTQGASHSTPKGRKIGLTLWSENIDGSRHPDTGKETADLIDILMVVEGFVLGGPSATKWNSSTDFWHTQNGTYGSDGQVDFMEISKAIEAFQGLSHPPNAGADLNQDGLVNSTDLQLVVDAVFFDKPHPRADVNNDGLVDMTDVDIVNDSQGLSTLEITTASLPNGTLGTSYGTFISARYGTGQGYVWSIVAGTFPPGLTFLTSSTPSTKIDGMPSKSGVYSFTVKVQDSNGNTATKVLSITIKSLVTTLAE